MKPLELHAYAPVDGKVTVRVELDVLESADRRAVDEAWGALHVEFGPKGEIERREVVDAWLARDTQGTWAQATHELITRYCLIRAMTPDGRLAAVRDCHVIVNEARGTVVVYLAHVLVLPEFRRTGLAALMRAAASSLGFHATDECKLASSTVLLAAEMEPIDLGDSATIIRLASYARAGFAAIEPSYLPYAQPDFRAHEEIGDAPKPVPLLAVARIEGEPPRDSISSYLAKCFVDHLYDGVFESHCRAVHLAPLRARMHAAIARAPGGVLPLRRLPTSATDYAAIAPLLKEKILPLHGAVAA